MGFAKAGALGVVFADVNLDAATSVSAPCLWINCGRLGQRQPEHCLYMPNLLP